MFTQQFSPSPQQSFLSAQALGTSLPNENWTVLSRVDPVQICKFDYSGHHPLVSCVVEISAGLEWIIYLRSVRIETNNIPSLSLLPAKVCNSENVWKVLQAIDECLICPGNEYATFAPVLDRHNGVRKDISGM